MIYILCSAQPKLLLYFCKYIYWYFELCFIGVSDGYRFLLINLQHLLLLSEYIIIIKNIGELYSNVSGGEKLLQK